jgi:hypothetical protein
LEKGANRTTGWALGSEEFRKELLARMDAPVGQSHYGLELRESDEEKARRLIAEEMAKLKFPRLDFSAMNKGDERKVKIAAACDARPPCRCAGLRRN